MSWLNTTFGSRLLVLILAAAMAAAQLPLAFAEEPAPQGNPPHDGDSLRPDSPGESPNRVDRFPFPLGDVQLGRPEGVDFKASHYIICQATIDTQGHARGVVTLSCEGEKDTLCGQLSLELLDVKFAPAYRDGRKVVSTVVFPVTYPADRSQPVHMGYPIVDRWEEGRCIYTDRIYGSAELRPEDRPIPTAKPEPAYPEAARIQNRSGRVSVRLIVDPDGHPCFILCEGTSAPGFGFVEAAVDAVVDWRFIPGHKDGKPQAVWVDVPFEWQP